MSCEVLVPFEGMRDFNLFLKKATKSQRFQAANGTWLCIPDSSIVCVCVFYPQCSIIVVNKDVWLMESEAEPTVWFVQGQHAESGRVGLFFGDLVILLYTGNWS